MDIADKTFIGVGWQFPPEFDNTTNEVMMSSDDKDIMESLYILLSTHPGERIMNPAYGCGIKSLVFENIDESMITLIKDTIERAVLFFETRITLNHISVDLGNINDGVIDILLEYTIRKTNNRSNMVYPFYFREGTNLQL